MHLLGAEEFGGAAAGETPTAEALLLYCEATKHSLQLADQVWTRLNKESAPEVRVCIVDTTKEKAETDTDLSRTEIMSWCLGRQFELVECDEVAEGEDEEVGGIADLVGKDRIVEALRSHTWSTMKLLSPDIGIFSRFLIHNFSTKLLCRNFFFRSNEIYIKRPDCISHFNLLFGS